MDNIAETFGLRDAAVELGLQRGAILLLTGADASDDCSNENLHDSSESGVGFAKRVVRRASACGKHETRAREESPACHRGNLESSHLVQSTRIDRDRNSNSSSGERFGFVRFFRLAF